MCSVHKCEFNNILIDKFAFISYNQKVKYIQRSLFYLHYTIKEGISMELDKYIKKVLIDKNVKQVELAERLNISRASLGGLISRNKMGVDKLEDIATALNCELKISFIDKETGKEY